MNAAAPGTRPDGGRLIERLPPLRGRLTENAPLAGVTWFRVGGPAEVMFKPEDLDDLADFLAGCPADVPITVIGVASNLLVRDGGVRGVVIRLGRAFVDIAVDGGTVTAGAAALDVNVARTARNAGLTGLEFLVGIPGTIGGALRMNAGAYGSEIKDVLVEARAIDRAGKPLTLAPEAMGLSYRHTDVPEDVIFTGAVLRAGPGEKDKIAARMAEIGEARGSTQPVRARTGGSTFANPPGHKAWELIDKAGCRGLRVGGAQVSEMHCNFLINTGDATAGDLETLGETVRDRVREAHGIELRWEIRRIGEPAGEARHG
ncbi:MAG: UDP-N-acetylmuramate dehydrogenase [Inquilinus sp.]|nr:UDP-N-acetylmuramate dehydrogenase [Inquilinus sp.]